MNREEAKLIIANLEWIKGFADGRDVQIKEHYNEGIEWESNRDLSFLNTPDCYRFKPEPREFWIKVPSSSGVTYSLTEEELKSGGWKTESIIKVREVIE